MSAGGEQVVLDVAGVRAAYVAHPALAGVTLRVERGEWLGILGPNGSGKTTLLRVLGGYLRPLGGTVLLEGRPVASYPSRERARRLAGVGAEPPPEFGFTVLEFVLLGRIPHAGPWEGEGEEDRRAVERALRLTGTEALAGRPLAALSAGERQRVYLARALAQRPRVLLLDEPTAHLDLRYQQEVLALLERLRREEGLTLVTVLHDLNLAALYCQRLLLLAGGRVLAAGGAGEVLRPEVLRAAYGCEVCVAPHPVLGVPQVLPAAPGGAGGPA